MSDPFDVRMPIAGVWTSLKDGTTYESLSTPPPPTLMGIGSCPGGSGGSTLSAAKSIGTKYGGSTSNKYHVRQFFSGFQAVATDAEFASIHASFAITSASYASLVAGSLDSAITTAVNSLRDGDYIEWCHEVDHKVRQGTISLANAITGKNYFYNKVKSINPNILVPNTLTWGLFQASETADKPDDYKTILGDTLGIDWDGGLKFHTDTHTYSNLVPTMDRAATWANGKFTHLIVPEFTVARDTTNDATGSIRAAWLHEYADQDGHFADYGYEHVCLFDFDTSPNDELTTTAEINAWTSILAASNA